MTHPIYQVDAFTERAFFGNPAAVCLLESAADPAWMLNVAREMNLSETAFLTSGDQGFDLRWFTPTVEVDLCGHATLASAHVLWETGRLAGSQDARFNTRSGLLVASRRSDWIELDFPAKPVEPAVAPAGLLEALGVQALFVGRTHFDYLVEVESESTLRSIKPDFKMLRSISVRGVIVTCPAEGPRYDFVSRFFAPGSGIDEDPVTGSAHCSLGPFWRERLGKTELTAYQASARGGEVSLRVEGKRVILAGRAVTVVRGELLATAGSPDLPFPTSPAVGKNGSSAGIRVQDS